MFIFSIELIEFSFINLSECNSFVYMFVYAAFTVIFTFSRRELCLSYDAIVHRLLRRVFIPPIIPYDRKESSLSQIRPAN
jgi:hypothetical protein